MRQKVRTGFGKIAWWSVASGLCCLLAIQGCGDSTKPAGLRGGGDSTAASTSKESKPLDPRCVLPTPETIESGAYTPLSRPLFLHVNKKALSRPEVVAFLRFYLKEGQSLVSEVGYIRLKPEMLSQTEATVNEALGAETASTEKLTGAIKIDGSSTVFPISQAVAERFMEANPGVKITVGSSGTGGGFKKFTAGETDINDSSRTIDAKEIAQCKDKGIEYVEIKVAIDGLTVVVNPKNDWCSCMTVEQLKLIWEPGSKVKKWSDVDPEWPDKEIRLFGADSDSGTFDYFTEAINGKAKLTRTDYTASSDDNVLVIGVEGDKYSLGYFGFAYFVENKEKLKAVGIIPPEKKKE